ncbi:DUF1127 domain-containing protein [Sulfitobacter sp. R18_1]|uniref:DUF1127 domain-containing protein n=1 Tax=Sulfitobacter sp. R18_1 TaxID=2821104 RepID=UPI001AD9CA15|nr:DUF1127 domain-containing protein [Sulfitobacter sp. R18_1]MBO9428821.1 DUF1127 domain-containing protein [Sulfitobacter sp. R18_1]
MSIALISNDSPSIFRKIVESAKSYLRARKMYRSTFNSLSLLSDRELSDIGVSRGEIRHIATEAAETVR